MILQDPNRRRGDFYDTMQVCIKNGHKITEYYDTMPEDRQNHCDKCGSKTTIKCEFCSTKIKGFQHLVGVVGGSNVPVPTHCHGCGKGYPWRKKLKAKKTKRIEFDFKNSKWLFTHIVFPVAATLIATYLAIKFGWNKK